MRGRLGDSGTRRLGDEEDLPAWIVRGARLLRGPCAVLGDVELSPGALTPQDMARACGLHLSFFTHVCSVCEETRRQESCYIELDQGCVGLVTRAVCEECLPVHFAKHLREQAALDALVEAEAHREMTKPECGMTNDGRREG